MRAGKWVLGWALVVLAGLSGGRAGAEDKVDPMEAWAKAARPGPQHKSLASIAGSWTFTSKLWFKPGADPMITKGTAERRMVLGGRFLQEDVAMELMGKPFRGRGLTGYDNIQGKYVSTWIDSLSTGISQSVGSADKTGKVLTFIREEFDPISRKSFKSRDVLRIVSKDKVVLEMYKILPDGKEIKTMEIVSIRKPPKGAKTAK